MPWTRRSAGAMDWDRDDAVWIAFTGGPGVKAFLAAEVLGTDPGATNGR